jgi:hypothetical protein
MFTHIMLSAFMGLESANGIIGHAMLDDPQNEQTFDELTGYADIKPFDCVGTTLEVKQALQMITDQHKDSHLPFLLSRFIDKTTQKISQPDFNRIDEAHFVPEELIIILKRYLL